MRPYAGPPRSLASFMAGFKTSVARRVHLHEGKQSIRVWQRGYYEHVIRDDEDLDRIRRYILESPLRWEEDHRFRLT